MRDDGYGDHVMEGQSQGEEDTEYGVTYSVEEVHASNSLFAFPS